MKLRRRTESGDRDGVRRDASLPGVAGGAITAAFRTPKDGVGQTAGAGADEWIVFRVTDVTLPPVDFASDDIKKLKDTLQRSVTDEQVAQYVTKLESDIGTTINQTAFAQVTGAKTKAPKARDGRSQSYYRESGHRRDTVTRGGSIRLRQHDVG